MTRRAAIGRRWRERARRRRGGWSTGWVEEACRAFRAGGGSRRRRSRRNQRAGDLHPSLRNVFPRGTPEEDRLFKLLKHAYVDARYDPKFASTREELEAIAAHVRELRSRVEAVCRERIAAMDPALG